MFPFSATATRREKNLRPLATLLMLFALFGPTLAFGAELPPPVFLDPAPDDVTVDCFNDAPASVTLTAQTENGNVEVTPFDSLSNGSSTVCAGGIIFRIWEVTDSEGTTRVQQEINFGPSTDGPTFGPGLDNTPDTVQCDAAIDPNFELSYGAWLNRNQLRVVSNSIAGCAPITSITDNSGPLGAISCGDVIEVTYTVSDQCLQSIQVTFTYVIIDTLPPVLVGVPEDMTVSCSGSVPTPPVVTAEDCRATPYPVVFNEVDNQLFDGSCNEFEYTIQRTWGSIDSCGNGVVQTQTIEVVDNELPTFNRPSNKQLQCFEDWESLAVTGEPTDLFDNCTAVEDLDVTFSDNTIFQPDCNFNFNIMRSWTVTDRCGNSSTQVQSIFVGDNLAPSFDAPEDITVNCEDVFNFDVVGEPTNLMDFCTETPNTSFTDQILPGPCPQFYRITRTWRIFDDCNNTNTHVQEISVLDSIGAVFITPPQDLVTTCNNEMIQQDLFDTWVENYANVVAQDACSPEETLTYEIYVSGTTEVPTLPEFSCDAQDQTVRKLDVDVIVTDECGNVRTGTAQFRQVDTQPPNVFDCMPSQVVSTDPDVCFANVALTPPTIVDQCVTGFPLQHFTYDTVTLTSPAEPGDEINIPVDPVTLVFPINFELPINALNESTLTITLQNADAEGPEEFFRIIGEDGSNLGVTGNTDVQCADVTTEIILTRQQFNAWATDGMIIITLEPNIPADQAGNFAINDICTGGTQVFGEIFTPIRRLSPLVFEIIIDEVEIFEIDPVDTLFANLEPGLHQITYRVTDCAGNIDECIFTVTVEDLIPPTITCPEDLVIMLDADSCTATIDVPLPLAVEDNCSIFDLVAIQSPAATSERFLTFDFNADAGEFQAEEVIASFPEIPPFTVDTTELTVFLQGDFNGPNATLEIYTDDGFMLGNTLINTTDCNSGPAAVKINIPPDQFNSLLADGVFGLRLVPGEGVNPCDEDATMQPGDIDGYSFAYVELAYNILLPEFYSTGATVFGLQSSSADDPQPTLTFNQGITEFSYTVSDPSGNSDTCSFNIEVIDGVLPVVNCLPTTIFIDPSGAEPVTIDPSVIDDFSSDNCGIDTIFLTPATFTCEQIGTTEEVTLTVTDEAGNDNSCTTFVGIDGLAPEPTANSGFCGGDSLFLFANPPTVAAPGQVIYTYQWFTPNNVLFSTEENPIVPGIDADDEGPYRVVITGITGCAAEGVINVNIEDLPITPAIEAPQSVCIGDPIPLSTNTSFIGNVEYNWFEGTPGSGTLLATTPVPEVMIPGPHGGDGRNFYLQVSVNGCPSGPSTQIEVTTVVRPEVAVANQTVIACEFDIATLLVQNNPLNLIYEWEGPNNFTATGQEIEVGPLDNNFSGTYYVRSVLNEGCFSEPDSLLLGVIPASPQPTLFTNSPVCIGQPLELTATVDDGEQYVFMAPNGQQFVTDTAVLLLDETLMQYAGDWQVTVDLGTCPSSPSEPIAVLVNNAPVANTQQLPDPVCTGNDLILQGSSNVGGSSYAWTGPNNFSSNSIAPVLEEVDATITGNYVLTVTDPNGCVDTDTLAIEVREGIEVLDIVMAGEECLSGGETIGLIAQVMPADPDGNYDYSWSGPGGLTSNADTLFIPDVSPMNSGTYSVTVSNDQGCVSPVGTFIVDLQFAPAQPATPITADGEIGYCLDESFFLSTTDYGPGATYFWQLPDGTVLETDENEIMLNATDLDFSGNYRVRVLIDGCPSPFSDPLEVIITDFPAFGASAQTPVCEGEPIQLQATDLPGAMYSWRGPSNFSSSLAAPVITTADADVHSGTYEVVATIGGCASDTMTVEVDVQQTPGIPVGVPQAAICIDDEGAILSLIINENTTTPGATYQWFTENGTVAVTPAGIGPEFELDDFGLFPNGGLINFFVQAELNGCFSALSNALSIQLDIADVDAAQAGVDTTVCEGIHLLDAETPLVGNGRWTLVSGGGDIFIVNPNSPMTAVDGMTEFGAPYLFEWALSNGECKDYSRDTVTINVTSGEDALAGEDLLVCLASEIRLNASPVTEDGSEGMWSQNLAQEILGVEIVEPGDPNTEILGLEENNVYSFTWTVMSDCGIKSDVVLLNVSDPSPEAGDDVVVCNSERSTVIAADEPTIGSSGRWRVITDGLEIDDPDSPTTMVGNLTEGDNVLVWEIDEGLCGGDGVDTLVIEYKAPAEPVDDLVDVPFQGQTTFDPLENDDFPAGSFVEIIEEVSIGTLTAENDGTFTYQAPPNFVGEVDVVYLLMSDGCTTSSATVTLVVGSDADCTAPNIFTPNNDGVNDFFVVPCLLNDTEFPASEVIVYNQWGDEIFRSSIPYRNDFDGTYNGEDLPTGTYYYHIKFGTDREDAKGFVTIIR